jgi:hypothetical protein
VIVKVLVVTPEYGAVLVKAINPLPEFWYHWYEVAPEALTVKVVVPPAHIVLFAGLAVITGLLARNVHPEYCDPAAVLSVQLALFITAVLIFATVEVGTPVQLNFPDLATVTPDTGPV